MPEIIIIAGPNGAGKTTTAPALLKNALQVNEFVNADAIAHGLSAFQPEKVAIQAGRVMLERIHHLSGKKANFAFETTLASRTFAPWIVKLKKKDYSLHIIFLWLKSPDLAVSRVSERVQMGGHFVPEDTVKRRYHSGLKNFFKLYQPIADSWQLYDNSVIQKISPIASSEYGKLLIKNKLLWEKILEQHNA